MTDWACSDKKKYRSWSAAEKAARNLRRRRSAHAGPYACQQCRFYHVGNGLGDHHLSARLRRVRLDKIREGEVWA